MSVELDTYEKFVAALERRPKGMSALRWVANLGIERRPRRATEWLLQWTEASRTGGDGDE